MIFSDLFCITFLQADLIEIFFSFLSLSVVILCEKTKTLFEKVTEQFDLLAAKIPEDQYYRYCPDDLPVKSFGFFCALVCFLKGFERSIICVTIKLLQLLWVICSTVSVMITLDFLRYVYRLKIIWLRTH